jgi:lactate dehydrogenase-like 2-hydroxyacid dehydrogenase
MTDRFRLLVARRVPPAVAERARREFDAVLAETDIDADAAIRAAAEYGSQAIFSGPKVRLTAEKVAALPDNVRIIANPSAGTDHMDVEAAKARGLIVTNTPDVLTDSTADLAFLLILAACRRAAEYLAIMRDGWRKPFRSASSAWVGSARRSRAAPAVSTCACSITIAPGFQLSVSKAPSSLTAWRRCCRAARFCPFTCPAAPWER